MEQLAPLGVNLGMLFVQIVNFIVLVVVLRVLLYSPIVKSLRQRSERIGEGLNNARKADEALASAEADKKKLLDDARTEAQRLTNEARARADEVAAQLKSEAQAEAKRILDQAQAEASQERDRVMADMRDQIASLSLAAANHLIGKSLTEPKQRELINEFFTSVPKEAKGLGADMIVVTAVPLKADEHKQFEKALGAKKITFRVDPSILGGVIVRAGGQQVDASFANQLASLRSSLS